MNSSDPRATVVAANQPADRFYAGGAQIAEFRGQPSWQEYTPEDWIASVTPVFGEPALGKTVLPGGTTLAEAVAADPVAWLGAEHVEAFGADTKLLVKLLDAGQRLPVHAHPDGAFAASRLGRAHGKTEAWIFLTAARVHLGFRRDISMSELVGWVEEQDTSAMLAHMHLLEAAPGDAIIVPAGMAHAIGRGAFLVELQEPEDLSILMEWRGFAIDGAADGHLGIGFDQALEAVDRKGWSVAEISALRTATAASTAGLVEPLAAFFRAERHRAGATLDPGFSILVCTEGSGTLRPSCGASIEFRRGQSVLIPAASGACQLEAGPELEVLRCRPPKPTAA
ncbi:MAG: class I mannose-6-phosphate isomerase [Arachnia sp.]